MKKLRSEKGASITFALLIFLVCAVVSSVVLTAATASAGRMSQTAKMDQMYYSVASAAKLLSADLDGRTIVVIKRTTQSSGSSTEDYYVYDKNGSAPGSSNVSFNVAGTDIERITPAAAGGDEPMLLYDAAVRVVKDIGFDTADPVARTLTLTSTKFSDCDVEIDETISKDGLITLTIKKKDQEKAALNKIYSLCLTFSVASSNRNENHPASGEEAAYRDEITEFSWSLKDIKTLR